MLELSSSPSTHCDQLETHEYRIFVPGEVLTRFYASGAMVVDGIPAGRRAPGLMVGLKNDIESNSSRVEDDEGYVYWTNQGPDAIRCETCWLAQGDLWSASDHGPVDPHHLAIPLYPEGRPL